MKNSGARNFADRAKIAHLPKDQWVYVALIAYIQKNNLDLSRFRRISSHFSDLERSITDLHLLDNDLVAATYEFVDSLDELQFICELAISEDDAKSMGAVYTPIQIVSELIENTLGQVELSTDQLIFLDPCCGSGNFLKEAIKHLAAQFGCSLSAASAFVAGIDINPESVIYTAAILDLLCFEESGETSQARLICLDSAITPVEKQLDALGAKQGFPSLATNPPYVKVQTLDKSYRNELEENNPDITTGSYSLATIFLSRLREYLAPNGRAGVITMNNIFTSLAGIGLRRKWKTERCISRIIDFRHFKVFSASAYTCLIYLDTESKDSFEFAAVKNAPSTESLRALSMSTIHFDSLEDKKWRLSSNELAALLSSLESNQQNLASIADIRVGIATLADKAFLLEGEAGNYSGRGGDGVLRQIETDATRPLVKISELAQNRSNVSRGVIFPYAEIEKGMDLISDEEFRDRFPNAFKHLESWRETIEKPSRAGQKLHEWGRRQSISSPGPKLLTKTFDKGPNFHLDTSDSLFCNGYSLTLKGDARNDTTLLKGLQHYLQSRFMLAYALMTSFEIDGGYQCYQKNFIENFAVPSSSTLKSISEPILPGSSSELKVAIELGIEVEDLTKCLEDYGFSLN